MITGAGAGLLLTLLLQTAAAPQTLPSGPTPPVLGTAQDVAPPVPSANPRPNGVAQAEATECAIHYGFAAFTTMLVAKTSRAGNESQPRIDPIGAAYQARARIVLAQTGRLNPLTDLPQDVLDAISGEIAKALAGDDKPRHRAAEGVTKCDTQFGFATLMPMSTAPVAAAAPVSGGVVPLPN